MKKFPFRVLLSVSFIILRLSTSFLLHTPYNRRLITPLTAYDLNSAFEWLSEERYQDPGYKDIQWLDLASSQDLNLEDDTLILPLYPLGASYLPSGVHQTLHNVEPQNLKMAQDLLRKDSSPRFCVTLRATDTGRVAHIGTVMRILEADEQYRDGKLIRIRLTCCPEELVEIRGILNPEAFAPEKRLRKSSEYLQAQVRPLLDATKEDAMDGLDDKIIEMINDFNMIKTIYQLQIGAADFPPSALFQLGNAMSSWEAANFSSTTAFWEAAQEWQSICYTIRQGKQAMLSINRNELMVEAAAAIGPLNLPIHLEDLPPPIQRQVQVMEVEFQKEFWKLGMDPCLDFQALLSLPNHREKILLLGHLIARERSRLEAVATKMSKARR